MTTSTTGNVDLPTITDEVNQVISSGTTQDWDQVLALLTATTGLIGQLPFSGRDELLAATSAAANLTAAIATHRPR